MYTTFPFWSHQQENDMSPPEKLSLAFDKPLAESSPFGQFIYPSNFPGTKEGYYHISHPRDTLTTSISIRHTERRTNMLDYPIGPEMFFPANVSAQSSTPPWTIKT